MRDALTRAELLLLIERWREACIERQHIEYVDLFWFDFDGKKHQFNPDDIGTFAMFKEIIAVLESLLS